MGMASRSNRSARSAALSGLALGWVSVLGTALPSSDIPIVTHAWDLFEDTRGARTRTGRTGGLSVVNTRERTPEAPVHIP
jgi:hypothetical protein